MLTTPVKSSMRSSWPTARLEFVRGRVKALRTLLLAKFTTRLAPEMETALAKLRSMPMPVTAVCETVKETVATGLLEAATLRGHAVLAGHCERVGLESLREGSLALPERSRVTPLYWPGGLVAK